MGGVRKLGVRKLGVRKLFAGKAAGKSIVLDNSAGVNGTNDLPTIDMSNVEVPPSLSSPMAHIDVPPHRPAVASAPSRRGRSVFWGALAVSVALLVAGVSVAITTYQSEARPAGIVERYFSELESGNASAALGFGAIPNGDRRLLTASVLREQIKHGRISKLSILTQKISGTNASVDIQYSIVDGSGSATVTDTVNLVKNDAWRLKAVVVPTRAEFLGAEDRVTLLGAAVPPSRVPLLMFPGATPFGFDTSNLRFTKESLVVRFTSANLASTSFAVMPSQPAIDQIKSTLDSDFKTCLAGKAAQQTLCPMPIGKRGVPGTLRGEVAQAPSSVVQVSVGKDAGGVLEIAAAVTVKGSYQGLDFNNMATTMKIDDIVKLSARAPASAPKDLMWWYMQ